ncbi:MAG: tRNA lysidine(34) synthetase TilS, partial [Gammaproteobacteria bacterium]|nr:tRNA lysidine(34) synthetase TilS [Gammaproteobacteria bacterium]
MTNGDASIVDAVATCLRDTQAKRVVVAFSGGLDSTALLHSVVQATREVKFKLSMPIIALHANHQLQPDSDSWEKHCEQMCQQLGVIFLGQQLDLDTMGNVEAQARKARYQFFSQSLTHGDVLLLGHHTNDQVESILLRLFQGRGLIPMRSQGRLGAGEFARPLLNFSHTQLRNYLTNHAIAWVEDDSNRDASFDRNFLRHTTIPALVRRWPSVQGNVVKVGQSHQHLFKALVHATQGIANQMPLQELPQDIAVAGVWLRAYLTHRSVFSATNKALEEFVRQSMHGNGVASLALNQQLDQSSQQVFIRSYSGQLYFVRLSDHPGSTQPLCPGDSLELPQGVLNLLEVAHTDALAMQCLEPLVVRMR